MGHPFTLLTTFAILFIGDVFISGSALVNAKECLDDEALVKVSYVPAPDHKYHDSSLVQDAQIQVRPSTSADDRFVLNITKVQNSSIDPFDVEVCVKKENACVQIVVNGPAPANAFRATWDNEEIDLGEELRSERQFDDVELISYEFTAATEYGEGCRLPCGEDEAQFEFQNRHSRLSRALGPYRVEDRNGNRIIKYDEGYNTRNNYDDKDNGRHYLLTDKKCLPKNECYRFIVGDEIGSMTGQGSDQRLVASFGDSVIFDRKIWTFAAVEFGDACPTLKLACDPATESSIEFFSYSSPDSRKSTVFWNVTIVGGSGGAQDAFYYNKQTSQYNITLHYDKICVPKDSCMVFSIYDPEYNKFNRHNYELMMDGNVYRVSDFTASVDHQRNPDVTYLGDCSAKISTICNSVNESLLELDIKTVAVSSSIYSKEIGDIDRHGLFNSWYVSETTDLNYYKIVEGPRSGSTPESIVKSYRSFRRYKLDTLYKRLVCIPNDECLYSLFMDIETDIDSYSMKSDGVLSTSEPYVHGPKPDDEGSYFLQRYELQGYEVTSIDDKCRNPLISRLSGGAITGEAIAGIAIACVFIVGALIAAFGVVKKRKKRNQVG